MEQNKQCNDETISRNHVFALPRTPARCCVVIHDDTAEADNIEPKFCPLCHSKLRLYQIHFNEKFLMCSNIYCDYPFGIDDYHVYKIECNDEFAPENVRTSSVTTGSTLSQNDWSELDKLMPGNENLFSPGGSSPQPFQEKPYYIEKLASIKKSNETEEKIKSDVKQITELNKALFECDTLDNINNTKWLQSLTQIQGDSGVQLLRENELKKVKTIIPYIGTGELKIDVDAARNVISVKIENETK